MFMFTYFLNESLIGGLVAMFYFPINIENLIIPIDELIFSEGWPNHQPDTHGKNLCCGRLHH